MKGRVLFWFNFNCGPDITAHGSLDLQQEIQPQLHHAFRLRHLQAERPAVPEMQQRPIPARHVWDPEEVVKVTLRIFFFLDKVEVAHVTTRFFFSK
jgi:hypothetical protein